ncbi:MAG TPA: transglycosylase SLT domain-containing protein [Myxococcota bacterium]|nr:transglycosylase SLT domain-containing protein [Myxococcota bacterium]
MQLAPRLLATFLAAALLGAAVGAKAGGPVAALQPTTGTSHSTSEKALRAALWTEARHLGADLRESLAEAITSAEAKHGIPALLLVALIVQESGFDPTAENAGALGLMQLRPFVAKDCARRSGLAWKGEATLLDPVRNVQIASAYFSELVDRFESLDLALAAYNKGPELVKRQLRNANDNTPTARFAIDVLGRYQSYTARFAAY